MKALVCLLLLILSSQTTLALANAHFGQETALPIQASQAAARPLRNEDVLEMVAAKLTPEVIAVKISGSACAFDTSSDALQKLKAGGVPDSIILTMVMTLQSAPSVEAAPGTAASSPKVTMRVPAGTVVELETIYNLNSQEVRMGDAISFRVVNPVMVDGVAVVAHGVTATALITKAERNGHFGRAGRITWVMKEVTAVDGSRLPLQFAGHVVGDSKGAKVATKIAVTSALLWPVAPVALLHGFKRGENARIPAGRRIEATVSSDKIVSVPAPR